MIPFTYLQFHLAFLVPAVLFLIATGFVSRSSAVGTPDARLHGWRHYWAGVVVITVVALAYTTPWDNYLIARGVWWYGDGRTLFRLWHAPIEEYLFILIQPWITALWLSHFHGRAEWPRTTRPIAWRVGTLGLAGGIGVLGWWLLGSGEGFYLGAVLAWAAPVLAIQWIVGSPQLWAQRRTVALGTLIPTLYLCTADRIAIEYGVWVISGQHTTGITVGGLPIEEAVFFLVTNLFVVQGLVLYRLVTVRVGDAVTGAVRMPEPADGRVDG